jgi:hypothetical protein
MKAVLVVDLSNYAVSEADNIYCKFPYEAENCLSILKRIQQKKAPTVRSEQPQEVGMEITEASYKYLRKSPCEAESPVIR